MNTGSNAVTATVFVIDDDDSVRKALSKLLCSAGFYVRAFASGPDFFASFNGEAGCIILDLQMPESSGLELQETLATRDYHPPIIFLTGYGSVRSSVSAIKMGAVEFLEKPVEEEVLLAAVEEALEKDREARTRLNRSAEMESRLKKLTSREFQVLRHVIAGSLNKQIASTLEISEKTVKVHRARVMEKLAVRSVAELVRLTEAAGVQAFDLHTTKVQ